MKTVKQHIHQGPISVRHIITGLATAVILTLILTGILAAIQLNSKLSENVVGYICSGIIFLSLLLGNLAGAGNCEGKYIMSCSLITSLYMIVLLSVNIVLFDGHFAGVVKVIIIGILTISIACVLLMRPRKIKFRRSSALR